MFDRTLSFRGPFRHVLAMALVALPAFFSLASVTRAAAPEPAPVGREVLSLDPGWRFFEGDIPFPVITGHGMSYTNAKAGQSRGAAAPEFDDSSWKQVNLPHDWAVEQPFDEHANLSQGYRARGIGWYRRQFKIDPSRHGRHLELQFDGVATNCTVWFNGTVVHRNWCGYTSFYIDITPFATYGDSVNTISIRVDANAMEGWWYEGAGIYRHTYLVERDPLHVITDGLYANPVKDAQGNWTLPVEATLENSGKETADATVDVTLVGPDGKDAGHQTTPVKVDPLDQVTAQVSVPVAAPKLWSLTEPNLYTVRTAIIRDNAPVDVATTTCGFRTIRFDPDRGFFLNDQPVKIKGVCNHQDHAGVGVAVPDSLLEFRVRRLKEMGVNAYRCSHNPPARELLDTFDRMGILVMDENRNFNCSPEYIRQLQWMVRRDRNHPSVVLWSVFNEEPMQGTEQGYEMVRRMAAVVKKLDTSRPVTAAMSGGLGGAINVSQAVDVVGFNYQQGGYDGFHKGHPNQPITSSEDTSATMTRGEFFIDKKAHVLDSYDDQHPGWGSNHHDSWYAIESRPFVAGAFSWTGFDYRGEPTPFSWPTASSLFGAMDLCGFPKTGYFLRQAEWITDRPVLNLVPHWNWKGREGQPIKVLAMTNGDEASLSLNGQVLGRQPADKFHMVTWQVPYAPGKLEAVGYKDGKEVARAQVETTDAPAGIRLLADRPSMTGDGLDAQPVTVEVVDAKGRVVPTAGNMIHFEITGGEIIGLGNGDPNCHEPEKGNQRSTFNGLAQVIVRTLPGSTGPLVLRATGDAADKLSPAEVTVQVAAGVPPKSVAIVGATETLENWRMSPVTAAAPDPGQTVADNDMNSWTNVQAGRTQPFANGHFAIFRVKFKPRADVGKSGGEITFKSLAGKAQVWEGKKMLGEKTKPAAAAFRVALPPGEGERTINVVVESPDGHAAGLQGAVTVTAIDQP